MHGVGYFNRKFFGDQLAFEGSLKWPFSAPKTA